MGPAGDTLTDIHTVKAKLVTQAWNKSQLFPVEFEKNSKNGLKRKDETESKGDKYLSVVFCFIIM